MSRRRNAGGKIKVLESFLSLLFIIIKHNVKGCKGRLCARQSEHERSIDKGRYRVGVGDGDKDLVALGFSSLCRFLT